MSENELSGKVIGAAIAIHRTLGPGLLESAYRECLCYKLRASGCKVEKEKSMPIVYEGIKLDHGYRMDLLIENSLVVEIKTVETLTDVHLAQVLTYLRLGNYHLGLLINFQVDLLKNGLQRVINDRSLSPSNK
jgi:GxxExxY protein